MSRADIDKICASRNLVLGTVDDKHMLEWYNTMWPQITGLLYTLEESIVTMSDAGHKLYDLAVAPTLTQEAK